MTRTPAQFAERTVAWLLLASAVLGLAVALAAMLVHRAVPASPGAGFWVAALGVLSGGLALRRSTIGVCGGLACFALQVFSYYPYSHAWAFSIKAGLSLAAVVHLAGGVLVVNVFALAMVAASAVVLARRLRVPARVSAAG